MPPDELRATLSLSALAGGAVWGIYHLSTSLLAGQPVHRRQMIDATLNVVCAMLTGVLVAGFVGPALLSMIPLETLKEPHAAGFGMGFLAFEGVPYAIKAWRLLANRKAGGAA